MVENAEISKEVEVLKPQDLTIPISNAKSEIISHFSIEQMQRLLARLPPDKNGMLFQFLWRTGVRVSEAIKVCRKDLDFDNDEIMIRWLKNRKYQHRVIPMHSSLKTPLYMFTAKMLFEDRVFPITRQRVDQLCKQHGFDHAHKIRHSFAINFLRQSDSPMALVELRELLGHSNIQTTMEYLRVVPMSIKKALGRIKFD